MYQGMNSMTTTNSGWDCYNENEPKADWARLNLYWFDQIHRAYGDIMSLEVVEKQEQAPSV